MPAFYSGEMAETAMTPKDNFVIADASRWSRMPNQQREGLARNITKYLRGEAPSVPDTL